MSCIDPHDLVCAWLDIPFADYPPSASPASLHPHRPHTPTSYGSLPPSPSPLHSSSARTVIPSPPPNRYCAIVDDNGQHSGTRTHPGKRRRLTPALRSPSPLFQSGLGLSRFSDGRAMNSERMGGVCPPELLLSGGRIPGAPNAGPSSIPPLIPLQSAQSRPTQLEVDTVTVPIASAVGYAGRVMQAPPRSRSNKRGADALSSSSPSKATTTIAPSEIRAKRQFLERLVPSCIFGPPPLAEDSHNQTDEEEDTYGNYNPDPMPLSAPLPLPVHVLEIIRALSPSNFEVGCIPQVPGASIFLETFVPYEVFHNHSFLAVPSRRDHTRSLALLRFAVGVHRTCTHNCANALDEAAWYPCVQSLLSVTPGPSSSPIPYPPPSQFDPPSASSLFLTIDATTKLTSKDILPEHPNVKLDVLVVFNHKHKSCAPTITLAGAAGCKVNALADHSIDRAIVALGVEVKPTGGGGGLLAAEYQLGVFGMKTLEVARLLAVAGGDTTARACDVAVSLSVCGHVWSLHVTYWVSPSNTATHGPVIVGSTDTLLGTMKVVMFVAALKRWARERALPGWKHRIEAVVESGKVKEAAAVAAGVAIE